ncbi:MAG TPA: phytanoyl-CoA dioxygenase family protein [Terriglobales bacterium]|nr:phytanoyl-CoA dioxygenase family protein [Terriglobales bacterium]
MARELIAAAARGDTATLEPRLVDGADPNCKDEHGATALHRAVEGGHAQAAACLLAYGADPEIADQDGLYPLSLSYTTVETLHAVRQQYRRFRKSTATRPTSPQVEAMATELARNGIVKVSGWVEPQELATMKQEFEQFARNLEDKLGRGEARYRHYDEEEHYWPNDRAYVCNNAFKYSRQLIRWCCRPSLIELSNHYLGRRAMISRGVAMRYLPSAPTDHDMFGWHHDIEDQRLKIMILLTDVGEQDQAMTYVLGSHRLLHPYEMFFRNTCSLEYCRAHLPSLEIFRTTGTAGDVFLFDSNGAHRGNRREAGEVRDVFMVEYASDRCDLWGGDISTAAFDGLRLDAGNPFEPMMSVPKKWNGAHTRSYPAWIEQLPLVESWLAPLTNGRGSA